MNKLFVKVSCLLFLSLGISSAKAQYISIPDTSFSKYLLANYPGAMIGNLLDTTNIDIISETTLNLDSLFIGNLEGIQYFDNLTNLIVTRNMIDTLPLLPSGLLYLDCDVNELIQLPILPSGLKMLNCSHNKLHNLPILPVNLDVLICKFNYLDSLTSLPISLTQLHCSDNQITQIPTLPTNLQSLNCSYNKLITLPILPSNLKFLNVSFNTLNGLGILPASLQSLYCNHDSLFILPTLPAALISLSCQSNYLSALPVLPSLLQHLDCSMNPLYNLPSLPADLRTLYCSLDSLSTLPTLPATLQSLNCSANSIPVLPTLPASLIYLNYSKNPITTLPSLPSSLQTLVWKNNFTPMLPILPNSLLHLDCSYTQLDSLMPLPPNLLQLICNGSALTFLPNLPITLDSLECAYNQLTWLPGLPPDLRSLNCSNNQISAISYIPPATKSLRLNSNPTLHCLPKLSVSLNYLDISNTSITCLPNYSNFSELYATSTSVITMPLCLPASGCDCAWNIAGNIHEFTSANCLLDSLNPGPRIKKLKVILFDNSMTTVDQMLVTSNGDYSFDTGNTGFYQLSVDTINKPVAVKCPPSGLKSVTLSPSDSLKPETNFAVECSGIDAGIASIIGRFRPAVVTHLQITAGDMAQLYDLHCTNVVSAVITTSFEGPIQYLQPSAGAIFPTSVSGNVLTYNVPDISALNIYDAFNIDVVTDSNAATSNVVCIKTVVSNVLADINSGNNTFEICLPIVNSFDPNAKYVSPEASIVTADWLTYTIFFQNTGSDTAYEVIIRDTLSNNLNVSSFTYLAASHEVDVELKQQMLTFYFHDINLLDSTHNEPKSHGWIQFKIRLKKDVTFGAKTHNTASIYFDFNSPIQTDTATHIFGANLEYMPDEFPVKVPNAISPNQDGLNDQWHILNPDYLNQKMISIEKVIIKNRWGRVMFEGSGAQFYWTAENAQKNDVYTYQIIYKVRSGRAKEQRGEIMVLE